MRDGDEDRVRKFPNSHGKSVSGSKEEEEARKRAREEAARLLAERNRRVAEDKLSGYRPYPKQAHFHELGATKRERMLSAASQSGKTWASSMETAMHATGRYPKWWKGKRFDKPTRGWVIGVSHEGVRDSYQRLLLGEDPDNPGTGSIPKDAIIGKPEFTRGVSGSVDHLRVRHVSGGESYIGFKSMQKGRAALAGDTVDYVAWDEEPSNMSYDEVLAIYTECFARTVARKGIVYVTYSPICGQTRLTLRFMREQNDQRAWVNMDAMAGDVPHYTREYVESLKRDYPPHEVLARLHGLPSMGLGAVFDMPETDFICDPFPIDPDMYRIAGIDFGIGERHPQAAVWLAEDRNKGIVYVIDEYRATGRSAFDHCAALTARDPKERIPIAWPADGAGKDRGSGEALKDIYRRQLGMRRMLMDSAQDIAGSNSVEASLLSIINKIRTGRFKIFSSCAMLRDEMRSYRRDEHNVVVRDMDDLISAMRYAHMALIKARAPAEWEAPPGQSLTGEAFMRAYKRRGSGGGGVVDIDPFTGRPIDNRGGNNSGRDERSPRDIDPWTGEEI